MAEEKKFTYEITEHIAVLSTTGSRSKELNRVSINGEPPKYDIRIWKRDENGERMLKGVTLSENEIRLLREALESIG